MKAAQSFVRSRTFVFSFSILLSIAAFLGWRQLHHSQGETSLPHLTIYTYSSFAGAWGAGPTIAKEFEKNCGCKVDFVDAGDGRMLVERLKIEGGGAADLAMGLDQFTLAAARELGIWQTLPEPTDHPLSPDFATIHHTDSIFVPYDWAPFTFIYRKGEIDPPRSLEDLKKPIYSKALAMMDPRSSTSGYQMMTWLAHFYPGDAAAEFLKALKPSVFNVSPSWSSAYGLFKKKQAKLAFSYLTSPVYHWKEEKDFSYQPAVLIEPCPFQIEYLGMLKTCKQCDLAAQFIKFIWGDLAQRKILDMNYMFPVTNLSLAQTEFEKLPKVSLVVTEPADDLVKKWVQIFQ